MRASDPIPNRAVMPPPWNALIEWAADDQDARTLGQVMDILLHSEAMPPDVQAIWDKLKAKPIEELSQANSGRLVERAITALETALADNRRAQVFWNRISLSPSTLEELGDYLEVSRQRIQQLQGSAEAAVRRSAGHPECQILQWRAWRLRQKVGRTAPSEAGWVKAAIEAAGLGAPEEWRRRVEALTLWLAGPFRVDDAEWLYRGEILDKDEIIQDAISADQSVDVALVRQRLEQAEVAEEACEDWIGRFVPMRKLGDKWYWWVGSINDKAVNVLFAHGSPMTAEEIVQTVAEGHSSRGTRLRLLSDRRFMRVDQQRIALRSWNLEEYTGIADEIAEELGRRGGEAALRELAECVASTFGVSLGSVITLSSAPRFVVEGSRIRLRGDHEPYVPRRVLTDEPGCYMVSAHQCVFRAEVTYDMLRGSGRSIPEGLGAWLGVLPGSRHVYKCDDHTDVVISWPDSSVQGPSVGSLRKVAEALGASAGDFLMLQFDRNASTVRAQALHAEPLATAPAADRLVLLTGVRAGSGSLEDRLAPMVGCLSSGGLRDKLRQRGESDLIELLPTRSALDLDSAFERLRSVL